MKYYDPKARQPLDPTPKCDGPATTATPATPKEVPRSQKSSAPAHSTVARVAGVARPSIPESVSRRSQVSCDAQVEEAILLALQGRELSTAEVAAAVHVPVQSVYEPLSRLLTAKRIRTDPAHVTYLLPPAAASGGPVAVTTKPLGENLLAGEEDPRAHEDALAQGKAEHAILGLLAARNRLTVDDVLAQVSVDSASTAWALEDLYAVGLVETEGNLLRLGNPRSLVWRDGRSVPFRLPGWDSETEPPGWRS